MQGSIRQAVQDILIHNICSRHTIIQGHILPSSPHTHTFLGNHYGLTGNWWTDKQMENAFNWNWYAAKISNWPRVLITKTERPELRSRSMAELRSRSIIYEFRMLLSVASTKLFMPLSWAVCWEGNPSKCNWTIQLGWVNAKAAVFCLETTILYHQKSRDCLNTWYTTGLYTVPHQSNQSKGLEMGKEKEGGNKAGYMATLVAWRWAGAVLKKVTMALGEEPYAQKA